MTLVNHETEWVKTYSEFVSNEDCDAIRNWMDERLKNNSVQKRADNFYDIVKIDNLEIHSLFIKLVNESIKAINYESPLYVRTYAFHLLKEGASILLHTDEEGDLGFQWSAVFYFNDPSEYRGGYLNYPVLGNAEKYPKGTMVTHPATYAHEVTEVKSGSRYSLGLFFTKYPEYEKVIK